MVLERATERGGAMTPERLADDCQHKNRHWRVFCVECVAGQEAHIRDLEAQVREAREALTAATKRSGQVINNWVTGGEDVCLVCGQIPNPDTHDEQCWVPLALAFLATATPPSPEVGA